jgi:hypothetical protein
LSSEFGLFEVAFFLIGLLFGYYLENMNRFDYTIRKIFGIVAFILGGTIVTYLFDNVFNVCSWSLLAFLIGIILGYYSGLYYKENRKSIFALFRGFAGAGSPKNKFYGNKSK